MYHLENIGDFKSVPQIVEDILEERTDALEILINNGCIDKEIKLTDFTFLTPLEVALVSCSWGSIQWLTEHGAQLNIKNHPAIDFAVRYCSEKTIRYLLRHGASLDIIAGRGDVFIGVLSKKRLELLPLIQELGHTVKEYGGGAFRNAVFKCAWPHEDRFDVYFPFVKYFLDNDVDVNYHKPDSVFTDGPTALQLAARSGNLELCRLLVEHGADAKITDKHGLRPYTAALQALSYVEAVDERQKNNLIQVAEYLKSIEPKEFHDLQDKLQELKPYKLPESLLTFLRGENLRFEFGGDSSFAFVEFYALIDLVEVVIHKKKFVQIMKAIDNYGTLILWNPKSRKIAFFDIEHEILRDVTGADEFIGNPEYYLRKIINGDYD